MSLHIVTSAQLVQPGSTRVKRDRSGVRRSVFDDRLTQHVHHLTIGVHRIDAPDSCRLDPNRMDGLVARRALELELYEVPKPCWRRHRDVRFGLDSHRDL